MCRDIIADDGEIIAVAGILLGAHLGSSTDKKLLPRNENSGTAAVALLLIGGYCCGSGVDIE